MEEPETVELFAGAERETVGAVVSGTGLETMMEIVEEVAALPAASRATAVKA